MTNILFVLSLHHLAYLVKATEIKDVDTIGLLKQFMDLIYLFIFVDLLNSNGFKETKHNAVKTLIQNIKDFIENCPVLLITYA